MSSVSLTSFLSTAAVLLVLGQGALAQAPVAPKSSAKLGMPALTSAGTVAAPDPGSLFGFANAIGQTLRFVVVGSTRGGIWGNGPYTSDSVLAVAAVHAGLLQPGQGGIVSVEIVPGLASYEGSERHGVTSLAYGAWDVAYRLVGVEPVDGDVTLPDPGDLTRYRGQDGAVLTFAVTGSATGPLWGDTIYTDDSVLAAAAVHAGVLKPGEAGLVTVEILPGRDSYPALVANGLQSGSYGRWEGSYRVLPPPDGKAGGKLSN